MRKSQINFINMARTTETVFNQQKALWETNKPVSRLVGSLSADLGLIAAALGETQVVTTGVTNDKEAAGDAAITLAVRLAGYAEVYALDQHNQSLAQQLHTSFRTLNRLPDAILGPSLRKLHGTMAGIIDALEDYGVTPAGLAALLAAIEKFESVISAPRVLISGRKATNQSIPVIIGSLRGHLQKLDNMMRSFTDTHPPFYHSYKNARIIIDLGGRGNGGNAAPDPGPQPGE